MNNKENGLLTQQSPERAQMRAQPTIVQTMIQEEEDFSLRQFFSVIRHRVLLITVIALSTTAAISLWTFLKTPIYQGKFLLLIGKPIEENPKTLGVQDILPQLGGQDIDYETQIKVLSSPQLLAPIVKAIQTRYSNFSYENLIPQKGSPALKITQLEDTKILEVSYQNEDPEKIKVVLEKLATSYLNYSSKERKSEYNQGLDFVNTQLPLLNKQVNQRQQQLQQFRQKYNFLDPDKEAQRLSGQFADVEKAYIEAQIQLNEANSRYQILQKQVGLAPNQAIVTTYLSESPGYQNLLRKLQEVELELAKQSAIFSSNNPIIETLQETRANLLPLLQQEAQRALGKKLPEMLSSSPSLVSQSALRVDLTKQLVEAANEQVTLGIKVQSLAQAIEAQKSQVQNLAVLARRYTDLQREVEISTTSLNRFLEEQQKLELQVAQQVIPWKIIAEPTTQDNPISPKPMRNISLGIIGGLLLGLGAALLAERLDPVYHSADEIKEDTKLPILGTIPWQKELTTIEKVLVANVPQLKIGDRTLNIASDRAHSPSSYQSSPFLEAFRTLNTNIRLLGSDASLKSLVFSSVSPGDGKTTISTNMAKAAAAMGQRVLLVDADLRRPQVHVRLDLENEHGLSNVIATNLDWKEAIQELPRFENLSVLTSGDIPPDPTRLLSSQKMKDLMAQLQEDNAFDLIIYDLPPISSFADARILAALTTGIILVTKLGKTDRFALKNIIEELRLSQISVLGLIANNVTRKQYGYGYYGYYKNQG